MSILHVFYQKSEPYWPHQNHWDITPVFRLSDKQNCSKNLSFLRSLKKNHCHIHSSSNHWHFSDHTSITSTAACHLQWAHNFIVFSGLEVLSFLLLQLTNRNKQTRETAGRFNGYKRSPDPKRGGSSFPTADKNGSSLETGFKERDWSTSITFSS